MTPPRSRRLEFLDVDPSVLTAFFQSSDKAVSVLSHGLPDDAVLVGVEWYVGGRNAIRLVFESDEFDEVPDGYAIPPATRPMFQAHSLESVAP